MISDLFRSFKIQRYTLEDETKITIIDKTSTRKTIAKPKNKQTKDHNIV